jgi:hypothetical protein
MQVLSEERQKLGIGCSSYQLAVNEYAVRQANLLVDYDDESYDGSGE